MGALRGGPDGGRRHALLLVLDPRDRQLEADPAGLHDRPRRPLLARGAGTTIISNPSFPDRLGHPVSAFYVTTGLRGPGHCRLDDPARPPRGRGSRHAVDGLVLLVDLRARADDPGWPGRREHEPSASRPSSRPWRACGTTGRGVPASIVGMPNQAAERNDWELSIPVLGSLYLTHSLNGEVQGPQGLRRPTSARRWRSSTGRSGSWSGSPW